MSMMVRVVLALLLLSAGAILVLENTSPIAVTFLGIKFLSLSLGLWVLVAVLCGVIAGMVLGGLMQQANRFPARPRSRHTTTSQSRRPSKAAPSRVPPATDPNDGSDWYTPVSQDWAASPPRRTETAYNTRPPRTERDEETDEESLWSRDRVVDADYRVLTPPNRARPDDEWEDEFFEDNP